MMVPRSSGDAADRFAHLLTPVLLMLLLLLLTIFPISPISCWCPEDFTDQMIKYTNNFCFHARKTYLPNDNSSDLFGREEILSRHRWFPAFLLFSAAAFVFPGVVWMTLGCLPWVPVPLLAEAAGETKHLNGDSRQRAFRNLAGRIGSREIGFCSHLSRVSSCLFYLVIKLLYIFIWILQLNRLEDFAGTDISLLQTMWTDHEFQDLALFPHSTQCWFELNHLGDTHQYDVACQLPLNGLLSRVSQFLFVWFCLGFFVSSTSLVFWLLSLLVPRFRSQFVRNYLEAAGHNMNNYDYILRHFVNSYIRSDGLLVLRMVQKTQGEIPTQELISALWANYQQEKPDHLLPISLYS